MFFLLAIFVFSFLITKLFIPIFYNLLYNSNCVKENFLTKKIPVGMGITFIPVITLVISLIIIINKKISITYIITFLIGILGIGIVGLIDDLLGNRNDSGLKGHLKKLFKGQLTTGGFKAVFGFIIGFLISLIISEELPNIIINILIIVLFTNLINLLDLRPARALKGFIFLALLLIYPILEVYRLIISGILGMVIEDFTVGKQMIIKGTEVSFYMPPTGMEVVADENKNYIREAVTLERLEYCILLDENGNKRYIKGPDVVFPKPTEKFITENDSRKFKAIELNEISGIYIKVIAPYKDGKQEYKVGDELFITGKEQMIYFPKAEHAIIKYGGKAINYAVAIPAGEARYVLNRLTGQISLQKGPAMFLPDPRKEVIIKRVLDNKQVELWFPGNKKALDYNQELMDKMDGEKPLLRARTMDIAKLEEKKVKAKFVGDSFQRGTQFTPPRTITLDTKYEGTVAIGVWTGYAILVISKTGERKVIKGPQTYLLEYDEILGPVTFSTGTPKTDRNTIKTVYLRTLYNKISDVVVAETKDLCEVSITLSYRVNFEGNSDNWFNVENYIKFLTDHMRSILRYAVRLHGIEDFYMNAIQIVRDTVLGKANNGKRKGRLFEENGMKIYDVEILDLDIGDDAISDLLIDAQQKSVEQTLEITTSRKELDIIKEKEKLKQLIAQSKYETELLMLDLKIQEAKKRSLFQLEELNSKNKVTKDSFEFKVEEQGYLNTISNAEISRTKSKKELELAFMDKELSQKIEYLRAEVDAIVNKSKAISPQFISALQSFSDKALAEKMAESMSPLAILGGKSVTDILSQLLRGTTIEDVLNKD